MVKLPIERLGRELSLSTGTKASRITIKRIFDIVVCCLALLPLLPVFALIALGIRQSSPGPVLYYATRVGLNGKLFTMYKFRTMHQVHGDRSASVITAKNDQRIYGFGQLLRRLKLDELPQLFNILKGEMSLVGPRPEDPHIVEQYYSSEDFETLSVLPGLTSPGSIYYYTLGEALLTEDNVEDLYVERLLPLKLAMDTEYVREQSFPGDFRIMIQTLLVVLSMAVGRFVKPKASEQTAMETGAVWAGAVPQRANSEIPVFGETGNVYTSSNLSESPPLPEPAARPEKPAVREEFLPFALPDIDESELSEIKEVLDTGWITTGPKTRQFEAAFAEAVGAGHAVAVNSCTAAMHLALEAISLQPGDFVLTSPYTFAATAEVIRYFDATPVFVDVEHDTLNLDPNALAMTVEDLSSFLTGKCEPKTKAVLRAVGTDPQQQQAARSGSMKAIIPIHIAGLPADLDPIYAIAAQYGLAVIEDAAHAFPAAYKGSRIGQDCETGVKAKVTSLTCYSFYSTKTITTGEGGMICTKDEDLAERCRMMSLHGISKDAWKRYTAEGSWFYEIVAPGFKYNLTDVAAAMGLAQLRKADRMWSRRQEIASLYNEAFQSIPALQTPADRADCQHAWHLYPLRLNLDRLSVSRNRFLDELKASQIGTSVHFIPLHLHPYYREKYGFESTDFPIALQEFQRVVSLPIYSRMSNRDVTDVVSAVTKVVEQCQIQ